MLNFIKKNKYKIIILPAVLIAGIFIGGCTNGEINADGPDIFDEPSFTSEIVADKETKVEYIVVKRGINVYGISPRLNSDGKPMIEK